MLAYCQAIDTINKSISQKLSGQYINKVDTRSTELSSKLDKTTAVYLGKLQKQEEVLQKQLAKIDSSAAKRIFNHSAAEYGNLNNELKSNSQNVVKGCGKYLPGIDTAITSLKFLQQVNLNSKVTGNISEVKKAMTKVQELENQFKKADNVEDFIRQRKEYLMSLILMSDNLYFQGRKLLKCIRVVLYLVHVLLQ